MVRAAAAKKSRPSASRSNTSSASSAKASAKSEGSNAEDWGETDQTVANAQGWGLYEVIDEAAPKKVFFEVLSFGTRFENDNYARGYVASLIKADDKLALKAQRAVFRSKAGMKGK